MRPPTGDVTELLKAWGGGDEGTLEKLAPLVYQELHQRARRYMANERSGHSLQTTALVNEVYLRLVDTPQRNWKNRSHSYAICAQLMRRILVDFARSRNYQKRGGGVRHLPLDEALNVFNKSSRDEKRAALPSAN
jgi:RNA polymerase sigma factor (TIGR02999 family)